MTPDSLPLGEALGQDLGHLYLVSQVVYISVTTNQKHSYLDQSYMYEVQSKITDLISIKSSKMDIYLEDISLLIYVIYSLT